MGLKKYSIIPEKADRINATFLSEKEKLNARGIRIITKTLRNLVSCQQCFMISLRLILKVCLVQESWSFYTPWTRCTVPLLFPFYCVSYFFLTLAILPVFCFVFINIVLWSENHVSFKTYLYSAVLLQQTLTGGLLGHLKDTCCV